MGGKNQYLGYLDMSRSIGSIDGYIGNIITCQRLDTCVKFSRSFFITFESDVAEVRLSKTRQLISDETIVPLRNVSRGM